MNHSVSPLLHNDEPDAVTVAHPDSQTPFVLVCDHASCRLPRALGTLGLSEADLLSHAGWDIGAAEVARQLALRLDATLVLQNYSRLVIDCNRPLISSDSIPRSTEWNEIGGNATLSLAEIIARRTSVFTPYHEALSKILDRRQQARHTTLLVSLHSFAPVFRNNERPWDIGLMYRRDPRLGQALASLLKRDRRLNVGINEPYAMDDQNDYTLLAHGEARQIAHVGLEIRQDLVTDGAGQSTWAGRLSSLLTQAAKRLESRP